MNTFLVAAEPKCLRTLIPCLQSLGGKPVHSTAWGVPSCGTAEDVRDHLRAVGSDGKAVVSEVTGGWALM